jgi:hypothetical protein
LRPQTPHPPSATTRSWLSSSPRPSSSDCAPVSITTVYVPTTVYSPPETITIAVENYTSVSLSLSSAASVDTAQVSNQNELNPVSEATPTTPSTFLHTIVVPVVEATIGGSNSSSGVYYVSIGQNTTDWSYTPNQSSTVVGTTTVTVSPFPTGHSPLVTGTETISSTTIITKTILRSCSAFSLSTSGIFTGPITSSAPPYPLTNGTSNSTVFGGASGSGRTATVTVYTTNSTITTHIVVTKLTTVATTTTTVIYPASNSTLFSGTSESGRNSVSYNATVTEYTTVATTTVDVTAYPSTSVVNGTQTANPTSTSTESALGYSGTNATYSNGKRQVCTLVYATISGNLASWCNDWDGHTVFHHSTYTSTCEHRVSCFRVLPLAVHLLTFN